MKYKNAKKVLPERLFKELQQYVQGEIIYVPGSRSIKAGWGEANGTKEKYIARNKEIIQLYRNGASINEIADSYYLSQCSIKKIVSGTKSKAPELESIMHF